MKSPRSYFKNLQKAITAKDLDKTRQTYADLNNTWTRNEAVVKKRSQHSLCKNQGSHFDLIAVVLKLPTLPFIQSSYDGLKNGIDAFVRGEAISSASTVDVERWDQALEEGAKPIQSRRRRLLQRL